MIKYGCGDHGIHGGDSSLNGIIMIRKMSFLYIFISFFMVFLVLDVRRRTDFFYPRSGYFESASYYTHSTSPLYMDFLGTFSMEVSPLYMDFLRTFSMGATPLYMYFLRTSPNYSILLGASPTYLIIIETSSVNSYYYPCNRSRRSHDFFYQTSLLLSPTWRGDL